jgi:hypothetical protein
MRNHQLVSFEDFRCGNCHAIVSNMHMLSAVNNRNHCPYCLWSCHLDLYSAGDRLSACKAKMRPVGLTLKRSRNKYQLDSRGELMLTHVCIECDAISINRIAADDDPETILAVFQSSLYFNHHSFYDQHGIEILNKSDIEIVQTQLYGQNLELPTVWHDEK